ncbi:MAG: hypothetical protein QNL04_04455 [SAR324 cluster bacterium]|nr:hypothetical protein [SAR324 cluster bacterium]
MQITKPKLILRIVKKESYGSIAVPNIFEQTLLGADLERRFGDQQKITARQNANANPLDQTELARFEFPKGNGGVTFSPQEISDTTSYRQNTVNGVSGPISRTFGKGFSKHTMSGVFTGGIINSVIMSSNLKNMDLANYKASDWKDNLKRFLGLYADLSDPNSKLYQKLETSAGNFVSKPNPEGYELQLIDEINSEMYAITVSDLGFFQNKAEPLKIGWKIDFLAYENKLDAVYRPIPDDVLDVLGSFRLPTMNELPVLGPLTTAINKLTKVT